MKRAVAGVSAGLLALTGIAAGALTSSASANETFTFTRLAGPDRYATAADIALKTFGTADEVLLAAGAQRNYPDALAGNYLAGQRRTPILLTQNTVLPQVTRDALRTLGTTKVTILGGTSAVSAGVEAQLKSLGYTVTRISGVDRYQTARQVALTPAANPIGVEGNKGKTALLASGQNFPDALAAGPVGFAKKFPVMITTPTSLSPATRQTLQDLGIKNVLIAGGDVAVTQATENEVKALGITTTRLSGPTRQLTAVAIANYARANFGFSNAHINLARGDDFADALTGGPHGGLELTPIILTQDANNLGSAARDYLLGSCGTLASGHIFGGTAAVSAAVADAATAAARCPSSATSTSTMSPSPTAAPTNQDFTITPAAGQTKVASTSASTNEGRTAFTVTGLNDAKVYDLALFPCDNVTTDANGVVTFKDAENTAGTDTTVLEGNNQADGLGTSNTGAAVIESVNNNTGGSTSGVTPVNGTITFTVDSTQADCAVAVLFEDTANDNVLNLNAANQPIEGFVASGDLNFTPRAAATGNYNSATVTSTIEAANQFVASTDADTIPDATFSYDANDSFFVPGIPGASLAQFEDALNAGDVLFVSYNSDPAGTSYFQIDTNTTPAPTNVTATVTNADGGATPNDVVVSFSPGADTPSGTTYAVQRFSVVPNGDGTCPAATTGNTGTGTAVVDTTNTDTTATDSDVAAGCYAYKVTATSPNGDPAVSAFSNTVKVLAAAVADTTPPTLAGAQANDVNDGVGSTNQVRYTFSEPVTVVDATKFSVNQGGVGGITFQGTSATISGNTVIVTLNGTLNDATTNVTYTADVAAGAVKDAANNANAAATSNFAY